VVTYPDDDGRRPPGCAWLLFALLAWVLVMAVVVLALWWARTRGV
jgi:hypothetical protein